MGNVRKNQRWNAVLPRVAEDKGWTDKQAHHWAMTAPLKEVAAEVGKTIQAVADWRRRLNPGRREAERKRRACPKYRAHMRAYMRAYNDERNVAPEGIDDKAQRRARHSAKQQNAHCDASWSLAAMTAAQDYECVYCASVMAVIPGRGCGVATPDHVLPFNKGGANIDANVIACCDWCNVSKNARDPIAYIASLPDPHAVLARMRRVNHPLGWMLWPAVMNEIEEIEDDK